MSKTTTIYLDNKKFAEALRQHKKACKKADKKNQLHPIANRYIGASIMLLANRIATKKCFSGYSYIDEMISDGVENCIQYGITNFNPDKVMGYDSNGKPIAPSALAYFTQIISWAFIRRIQKEKKQQYIKLKNKDHHHLQEQLMDNTYIPAVGKDSVEFIRKFEETLVKKKKKKISVAQASTNSSVETFIEKD